MDVLVLCCSLLQVDAEIEKVILKAVILLRFYAPNPPIHEPKPHRAVFKKTITKIRGYKGEIRELSGKNWV